MRCPAIAFAWIMACCWMAVPSPAQVPQLINYQGRLTSGTNLVNGRVSLRLMIYTNQAGGTAVYEDSNTVDVVDGLYSTIIGDDTAFGSLADALARAIVYLEVVVDGTPLAPRERLVAVPYAAVSETVRGTNLFVSPASGYVGVGILSPNSRLHVAGSVALPVRSVSANYALSSNDYCVIACSNATITLPVAATATAGRIYSVRNSGSGLVFVRPNGADSLDGRPGTGFQLVPDQEATVIGEGAGGWRSGR